MIQTIESRLFDSIARAIEYLWQISANEVIVTLSIHGQTVSVLGWNIPKQECLTQVTSPDATKWLRERMEMYDHKKVEIIVYPPD